MEGVTVDIKTFMAVVGKLPPHISILIRGAHGIGKSDIVAQLSKEIWNQELVERRLGQMESGDMIGMPELDSGKTVHRPTDWFLDCVENPRVLFLDEVNRATPEVQQAAFQIFGSHAMHGNDLHPECRVISAINTGGQYQVNEMGPAMLDRFIVLDLEPTVEDWIEWAKSKGDIHPMMIAFISKYGMDHLNFTEKNTNSANITPTPRSWERLDQAIKAHDLYDAPDDVIVWHLGCGTVGMEATVAFRDFMQKEGNVVTAADVIERWDDVKERVVEMSNEMMHSLVSNIAVHGKENEWSYAQARNIENFARVLPDEMVVHCFSLFMGQETSDENVKKIAGWWAARTAELATDPDMVNSTVPAEAEDDDDSADDGEDSSVV